ncbi:hypothetical protein [uncultured Polaribacter sp.]|uniref:hypothetical protein n=1 Tax=uncultured Polaribacter sp. TaxID=174711 RepID=UPI00263310DB|nr:hypothetical protein [uncultured Polaribacter sp.]
MDFIDLDGKKILYISVKTFNYEKEIEKKLVSLGAKVDYFDERPSNSILAKGIIRVKRSLYKKKIDAYYKSILNSINDKVYDYFFLVKGEVIPSFFLIKLRQKMPKCNFIFYTWDSFDNNPNAVSILHFFDRKFTFDNQDAEKFKIDFRPLFYIDSYKNVLKDIQNSHEYELLFLGTAHSDRYKIGTNIVSYCDSNNFKSFAYYYMPSKLVYFIKSLFDSSFKEFDIKKISFKSLNLERIIELYKKSKIILDINHPSQRGMTMRTFEALGAGKKIITTNKEIKKYSFYNSNNVFVIDRNNIKLEKKFFESTFNPLSKEMLYQMSITGWLKSIFIENDTDFWLNNK